MREDHAAIPDDPARVGVSIRPYKLGRFSGDQAGVWEHGDMITICMVDGLGHGEAAEVAARAAVNSAGDNLDKDLIEMMAACDTALHGGRGAAVGLARIDKTRASMDYVGVGNTRCAIVGREVFHPGGVYGVVGEGVGNARRDTHDLERRGVIIFWTDGLPESLRLMASRVRRTTNARALANQLIDQHAIDDDDAGVVVVRWDA